MRSGLATRILFNIQATNKLHDDSVNLGLMASASGVVFA
jgi:hypothetical protein